MGNTINKIDEGLFICGVDALSDFERLHRLGIKCVLNAAQKELYTNCGVSRADRLAGIEKEFEVMIIGADDCETCNLSIHFQNIADFIEAGRAKGGVIVHCAAGISRASTSCLAYLMIKEHWTLEAAFHRVHGVRSIVEPNQGFWRQLTDLEVSLQAQGVELKLLPDGWQPTPQPVELQEEKELGNENTAGVFLQLQEAALSVSPFVTKHVTARLTPDDGTSLAELISHINETALGGVKLDNIAAEGKEVILRVGIVPTLDSNSLASLFATVRGVRNVQCEE